MTCAWTAESSRMKSSVQLGLLCLSLLISSLHGGEEEVEPDSSMQIGINFDEPDLHQFKMYRARRQTVSTEEENSAEIQRVAFVPPSDKKQKKKSRKNKGKKHTGSMSVLASTGFIQEPHLTDIAKMDTGGKKPFPES